MRFHWYEPDENATIATDSQGNRLTSKAVQSWYNPPDIDPALKAANTGSWTDYIDVDFDWIWGVPTAKKMFRSAKEHTIETIEGVKNIIPKTANYIMTLTVLIAAIVIVPRVMKVK